VIVDTPTPLSLISWSMERALPSPLRGGGREIAPYSACECDLRCVAVEYDRGASYPLAASAPACALACSNSHARKAATAGLSAVASGQTT